jgi:hypothetical protein
MFRYPLACQIPHCSQAAEYKIAARWSDGLTSELKTYALCCPVHLAELLAESRRRHHRTRTLPGEILDLPGVYSVGQGQRDSHLERLVDLERQLEMSDTGNSNS